VRPGAVSVPRSDQVDTSASKGWVATSGRRLLGTFGKAVHLQGVDRLLAVNIRSQRAGTALDF